MTTVEFSSQRTESQPITRQAPAIRLSGVDGLRGLAALVVVIFHMYGAAGGPEWRPWHHVNLLRPLVDGWAAVNLFLVLSGFCLYWPFAPRPNKPDRPLRLKEYSVRRAMRIMPAYYASLLFVLLVGFVTPLRANEPHCFPVAWWDVIDHLLLLNAWVPASMNSWNSVTWSLSLEWTWYIVFPLAMLLFRYAGAMWGMLVLSGITLVYRCGLYLALGPISQYATNVGFAWRSFVLGRLFEFGAGMVVATFIASGRSMSRHLRVAAVFVMLAALAAGRAAEPVDGFLPVRDILYGTVSAMLLLLVVLPHEGLLKWAFEHAIFVWLGSFSYTLYLFHLVFVTAFAMYLKSQRFTGLSLFTTSFLFLPVTLAACYGLYFIVERPLLGYRPKSPVSPAIATV